MVCVGSCSMCKAGAIRSSHTETERAYERVTFVPGPEQETAIVRRIFREFADEHRSVNAIADRLNEEGVRYLRGCRANQNWQS